MKCPKCKTEIAVSDIAKEMGAKGGSSRSEAKIAAMAKNLNRKGRPKGSKNKPK